MKLIIGLGNPEEKYKNNRHNVGHMFVDFVKQGIKTDVFMNESGKFVAQKVNFYKVKPEDLYIVHDDLDIPLGQWKIQLGVGPKVHNGINSIEETLGTKVFWRVRIGVDNRDPNKNPSLRSGTLRSSALPAGLNRESGDSYVLKDFSKEELEKLDKVFDEITRRDPFQN